jgi:hypothetical protein
MKNIVWGESRFSATDCIPKSSCKSNLAFRIVSRFISNIGEMYILQTIANNIKTQIMKHINLSIAFIVLFSLHSCLAQKLVQKESDIQKVKANENLFIGKSLNNFLKEIKPTIKRVTATPSKNIQSYVGNFIFYFMDNKMVDSTRNKGGVPITIVVFVKEYFDWDYQKRPKGIETVWTDADAVKYGNLTVVGFRIYGDATGSN